MSEINVRWHRDRNPMSEEDMTEEPIRPELMLTTETLLDEIARKGTTRNDVAKTYALAIRSSDRTNWARVNQAIIDRWSMHALKFIKERAWSGKCFGDGL